jgi:hypothetical protein
MLPGQDLQLEIGDWRGGGHGMAPKGAEPLNMGLKGRISGQPLQRVEDVLATHLLKSPQQIAGVIQRDPRISAISKQLGNDVGQTPIAMGEGFSVVVVTLAGMLNHVLEMGDQLSISTGWNRGLVHVQGTGQVLTKLLQLEIGGG